MTVVSLLGIVATMKGPVIRSIIATLVQRYQLSHDIAFQTLNQSYNINNFKKTYRTSKLILSRKSDVQYSEAFFMPNKIFFHIN